MELVFFVNLFAAGIRSGTAILFASIGEIFAERAGVLNLGVEGMMLMGAMTAFGTAHATGNPWLGLLVAAVMGGLLALLHAFVTITLRADQVVSGLALTFVGTGLSAVLGAGLVEVKSAPRLPAFHIHCCRHPVLGPIFFQHNIIVYLGFLLAPLAWFYIYRRARPRTARHRRIPRRRRRAGHQRQRLTVPLCDRRRRVGGMGAASARHHPLGEGMTAGQGWIAIGLVIFAGWNPLRRARLLPLRRHPPPAARPADPAHLPAQPTWGYSPTCCRTSSPSSFSSSAREAMRKRMGSRLHSDSLRGGAAPNRSLCFPNHRRLYVAGLNLAQASWTSPRCRLPSGRAGGNGPRPDRQAAGLGALL